MPLLAGSITHGQAVAIILLCILLFCFIVANVFLVLMLRRKNKRLAVKAETDDGKEKSEKTGTVKKK